MSESPLTDFANATFVWQVPVTGSTVDPLTGNRLVNRQAVTVQFVLNQKGDRSSDRSSIAPGLDSSAVYLEGRTVDPLILPVSIKAGTWGKGKWAGHKGQFLLLSFAPNSWGASELVGLKIRGWFQFE